MDEKIKEVQVYFKSKLLAGDFIVKSLTRYFTTVVVDEIYEFNFWMGNQNVDGSCITYSCAGEKNFIDLAWTKEEANTMLALLSVAYDAEIKRLEMIEYENLKSKLEL